MLSQTRITSNMYDNSVQNVSVIFHVFFYNSAEATPKP